jgi:hypothetical protein
MAIATKYGFAGSINANSGSYGSPTWVPIANTREVQVAADMDEFDASTRAGGGLKQSEPTMLALGVSGKIRSDQNDTAGFVALETAFLTRASLDLLVLDGAATVVGSRGYRADFKVFKFGEDQNIGNILHRDFELKPCVSDNPVKKAVVGSGPALTFTSLAA